MYDTKISLTEILSESNRFQSLLDLPASTATRENRLLIFMLRKFLRLKYKAYVLINQMLRKKKALYGLKRTQKPCLYVMMLMPLMQRCRELDKNNKINPWRRKKIHQDKANFFFFFSVAHQLPRCLEIFVCPLFPLLPSPGIVMDVLDLMLRSKREIAPFLIVREQPHQKMHQLK